MAHPIANQTRQDVSGGISRKTHSAAEHPVHTLLAIAEHVFNADQHVIVGFRSDIRKVFFVKPRFKGFTKHLEINHFQQFSKLTNRVKDTAGKQEVKDANTQLKKDKDLKAAVMRIAQDKDVRQLVSQLTSAVKSGAAKK